MAGAGRGPGPLGPSGYTARKMGDEPNAPPRDEPKAPPPDEPKGRPGDEALQALSERLGRAMTVIRDAMRAIAVSHEDIETRLREVAGEQQERFIEFAKAYAERARVLEERVGQAVKAAEEAAGGAADGFAGGEALAAAEREMTQTFQMLRAEVAAVRGMVEEWGQGEVGQQVAHAVAAQVEGILERRFEALAQLLESRIKQAAPPPGDEPRGLFRRSR